MRRNLLILCVLFSAVAYAQKSVIKTEYFSDTQARFLEVNASSYVRPLVVDLVVSKGQQRKIFKKDYGKVEVEIAMGGNADNLRSRAIYDAAAEWGCDAVVAATFKIELSADQTTYGVEMRGFPANFDPQSWHPMDESDFKWIEVNRHASLEKTQDPDRAGAVIKNIKR